MAIGMHPADCDCCPKACEGCKARDALIDGLKDQIGLLNLKIQLMEARIDANL